MKPTLFAAAALTLAVGVSAQNPQPAAAHDPVIVFPTANLRTRLDNLVAEAKSKGSSGGNIENYGSYKIGLSVRTVSGGAEIHAHWDDVMVVQRGTATLITGGTVIDGTTGDDGETHGTKIEGGDSRTIGPGDVLTIRAGTPHQLILAPGTVYGAVVIKVHEP